MLAADDVAFKVSVNEVQLGSTTWMNVKYIIRVSSTNAFAAKPGKSKIEMTIKYKAYDVLDMNVNNAAPGGSIPYAFGVNSPCVETGKNKGIYFGTTP